MPIKYKKHERLLAAIPVDRICRACLRPQVDLSKWRLSPMGDAICLECRDKDALANPDIYGDPVLKRAIWKRAVAEVKQARAKIARTKQLQIGNQCARCGRVHKQSGPRQEWVYTRNTWLCRKCYYDSSHLMPGLFCEDTHSRVFLVTESLRAQYPFGIQRIPRGVHCNESAQPACSIIYEQQRKAMWQFVTDNMLLIDKQVDYCANKYKLDRDICYDRILLSVMRAGSLFNAQHKDKQTDSAGLIITASHRAIQNYLVREQKKAIEILLSDLGSMPEMLHDPKLDVQLAEQEARIDAYLQACIRELSPQDWYIFTTWVIGNRSQAEIGVDLGVIPQAISMRIRKIRETCIRLSYILQDNQ